MIQDAITQNAQFHSLCHVKFGILDFELPILVSISVVYTDFALGGGVAGAMVPFWGSTFFIVESKNFPFFQTLTERPRQLGEGGGSFAKET